MIEHRALNARPRAHIDADLLAGDAAKQIGRGGEDADEAIDDQRCVKTRELIAIKSQEKCVAPFRHSVSKDHGVLSSRSL